MARSDLVLTLAVTAAAGAALVADYLATPFDSIFEAEEKYSAVPATLLSAIARQESGFRASVVGMPNSNGTRDYGLMGINDATARALKLEVSQLLDPAYNVRAGARILNALARELGAQWSPYTWVAAYNAGSPAILKRGVFNVGYASAVTWHWQLYRLAQLLQGRA